MNSAYSLFFKERSILEALSDAILDDNELMNRYSYGSFVINSDFLITGNIIGFMAITTVRDNKSFDKIMFFQNASSKNGKSCRLHVVECCELSDGAKVSIRGDEIVYDHVTNRGPFLSSLNIWLYQTLFYDGEKRKPLDIVKSGELFKLVDEGSEIKPHDEKPYDKYLEITIKPLKMEDQLENAENDIIQRDIERFMNTRNTTQNILKNIHMAGGPTNTLLRMPYRCVDGTEIKPNLAISSSDYDTIANKIANGKNRKSIDRLKKANREAFNKFIDKSLGIQLQ